MELPSSFLNAFTLQPGSTTITDSGRQSSSAPRLKMASMSRSACSSVIIDFPCRRVVVTGLYHSLPLPCECSLRGAVISRWKVARYIIAVDQLILAQRIALPNSGESGLARRQGGSHGRILAAKHVGCGRWRDGRRRGNRRHG